MKRFLSATLLLLALALGTSVSLALGDDGGDDANDSKVTICHAVEGEGNTGGGYSVIDVSKDSIVNGNGQLDPNGHGTDPHDIIPAFDAGSGRGNKTWGAFAGQGDASWISSNCAAPGGSTATAPTETTTTTPLESTTTTEPTTTADAPTTTSTTTETTTPTPAPPVTTDSQSTDAGTTTVDATTTAAVPESHTETADTQTGTNPASPEPQSMPNSNAGSPHEGVKAGSAKHKARASKRVAGLLAAATVPRPAPFTR
jgi:hypothetical protein